MPNKYFPLALEYRLQIWSITYINAFTRGVVLLSLPFFLLLFQLFNTFLQHIRPKITFKIWELLRTGQTILCCLLENVLGEEKHAIISK